MTGETRPEDPGENPTEDPPFSVVSFELGGQSFSEDIPGTPLLPGEHALEIVFSEPLEYYLDDNGELQLDDLDVTIGPYLEVGQDITSLAMSEDGHTLTGLVSLAPNTTYQMYIGSLESEKIEDQQRFYFGTAETPSATISGTLIPPEEYQDIVPDFTAVFLLDKATYDSLTNGLLSKPSQRNIPLRKLAHTSAAASTLPKTVSHQDDEEFDDANPTLLSLVRVMPVNADWSYELPYVPDGEYYVQSVVNFEETTILGTYGANSLEDEEFEPVIVSGGQGQTFLNFELFSFDFSFEDVELLQVPVTEIDVEANLLFIDTPEGERITVHTEFLFYILGPDGEEIQLSDITPGSIVDLSGIGFDNDQVEAYTLMVTSFGKPDGGTELPTGPVGPVALDLNLAAGDQGVRQTPSAPSAGGKVVVDLAAISGFQGALGFETTLTFDATQLAYASFAVTDIFSGASGPPIKVEDGNVTVSAAFLGGAAQKDAGSLGQVTFNVLSGFSGETRITLHTAQIGLDTGTAVLDIGSGGAFVVIGGKSTEPSADFDGDGEVGFRDFVLFARAYGSKQGDAQFETRFDLDGNNEIGFRDFVTFAQAYGK